VISLIFTGLIVWDLKQWLIQGFKRCTSPSGTILCLFHECTPHPYGNDVVPIPFTNLFIYKCNERNFSILSFTFTKHIPECFPKFRHSLWINHYIQDRVAEMENSNAYTKSWRSVQGWEYIKKILFEYVWWPCC
jgi:hypothetical protein